MGAFSVISAILAVRLILLVAVCGAAGLAYLVLQQADEYRLGVLGLYAGLVVLPIVWLAAHR